MKLDFYLPNKVFSEKFRLHNHLSLCGSCSQTREFVPEPELEQLGLGCGCKWTAFPWCTLISWALGGAQAVWWALDPDDLTSPSQPLWAAGVLYTRCSWHPEWGRWLTWSHAHSKEEDGWDPPRVPPRMEPTFQPWVLPPPSFGESCQPTRRRSHELIVGRSQERLSVPWASSDVSIGPWFQSTRFSPTHLLPHHFEGIFCHLVQVNDLSFNRAMSRWPRMNTLCCWFKFGTVFITLWPSRIISTSGTF